MTFKEFIKLAEQGTKSSPSGFGAGGRAGQSQVTPEMGVTKNASPNPSPGDNLPKAPKVISPSAFNVSSKFKANVPRPFGGMNAGGIKFELPKPSSISPRGVGAIQPLNSPQPQQPSKVPAPKKQ